MTTTDPAFCRPIRLSPAEAAMVRAMLAEAVTQRADILLWTDPIDQALKIKVPHGPGWSTWTPPIGTPT